MASFMRTAFPSVDEYMAQVNQYDAGRPTTKTADKPGLRVADRADVPKERFDASADAKSMGAQQPITREPAFGTFSTGRTPSFSWGNLRAPGRAGSGDGGVLSGPDPTISRKPIGAPDVSGLQAAEAKAGLRPKIPVGSASSFAATQGPSGAAQPSSSTKNAFAGNYAASGPDGQGIYKDPQTGRTSIRLTGDAGDKFMQDQNKLIAEGKGRSATAEDMAARRKLMGEYGGVFKQDEQEIPRTARPGITLQSTPVERKQMEVMAAERANKKLLHGPGTRDYIDPRLSVEQQRARQNEITAQRQQDMRDARDSTIAQTQARDAARAYNGLPTDEARNRAMEPYAERRATINARNNMAEQIATQAALTAAGQTSDKDRQAQVAATNQADATTRRAQDIEAESSRVVAESQAREKALDRQATLQAAQIKADGVKDPVMLKQIEGYNNALAKMMETPGTTISDEDIQRLKVTFGLINDDTRAAAVQPY